MDLLAFDAGQRLKNQLDKARDKAKLLHKKIVFGWQQPIEDLDFLSLFGAADNEERFFGEYPGRRQAFVALGRMAQIQVEGLGRFSDAARAVKDLLSDAWLVDYGEEAEERPILMGGFAFNDHAAEIDSHWMGFPAARLVLPELLLTRHESSAGVRLSLSLHAVIDSSSTTLDIYNRMHQRLGWLADHLKNPPQLPKCAINHNNIRQSESSEAHYLQAVEQALTRIGNGELEKVVLARWSDIHHDKPFSAAHVLHNLRENYPSCFIFAASMSGSSFLGATPERLLALRGRELLSGPLAGSVRRGTTPEEDLELQKKLLESSKERHEHSIVIRAIQQALEPHCNSLTVPQEPCILQLPGIQHLYSEISGTVNQEKEVSILEILGDLHPTPAVGGMPRKQALAWLAENEKLERGWFSGPVGWVNDRGEGDFAIALRVALLRGNSAHLHAGAGIVSGSVPEEELKETKLKMQTASSAILST